MTNMSLTTFILASLLWASAMSEDVSDPVNRAVVENSGNSTLYKTGKFVTTRNGTGNTADSHGLRFVMFKTGINGMDFQGTFVYLTLDGNNHERCQTKKLDRQNG